MAKKSTVRVPQKGDKYYSGFESDYIDGDELTTELTIESVEKQRLEDAQGRTGFSIWASDGIGYDCFWSDKLNAWVYSL